MNMIQKYCLFLWANSHLKWAKVENVFCVRTNYSLKFTLKTWKLHHLD